MSSSSTSRPATLLGRYRPFAKLASGGMADVYLAVAEGAVGTSRMVVMKRLRSDVEAQNQERFRAMFFDEAQLTTQFNHPNIVHTSEVGEDAGALFLVMEYAEGHTLSEVVRAGKNSGDRLPIGLACRVMCEVLSGLHYAHDFKNFLGESLHVVHRDVSPQNVVVGYDGRVRVIDFGIAKTNTQTSQTEVSLLKGKVRYMSPEHVTPGAQLDRRADIYSCGVMLWEMVTGVRLRIGDSAVQSLVALVDPNSPARSAREANSAVDPVLDAICARALAKHPSKRFQTAREMRAELDTYLATLPDTSAIEDLGVYVTGHFAEQRERLVRRLREELSSATGMPSSSQSGGRIAAARLQLLADLDIQEEGFEMPEPDSSLRQIDTHMAPRSSQAMLVGGVPTGQVYGTSLTLPSTLRPASRGDAQRALSADQTPPVEPAQSGVAISVSRLEARADAGEGGAISANGSARPDSIRLEPLGNSTSTAAAPADARERASGRSLRLAVIALCGVSLLAAVAIGILVGQRRSAPTQALSSAQPSAAIRANDIVGAAPESAISVNSAASDVHVDGRAQPISAGSALAVAPPSAYGLAPAPSAARVVAVPVTPGPLALPASTLRAVEPAAPLAAPTAAPTAASSAPAIAVAAPGFLTLHTYPWTRVSLNGRSLGQTALVGFSLPVGVHTLVLENAAEGISRTTTVTIKSGETVTRRLAY